MIPTIGEATPASAAPQLKMTPLSSQKAVTDDSKCIPKSSFSKESCKKSSKVSFDASAEKSDESSNATPDSETPSHLPLDQVDKADRVVSFNKRVRIRKIKMLEDMPPEQIAATYFSEAELGDIRNGLRNEIRSLVEQNFQEDLYEDSLTDFEGTFCLRGLEHEFPKGKYKRKQLKMMSRGAVLEEQRLQREFFVHNERSESSHDTATTLASTLSSFSYAHEDPSLAIADVYRIESKPAVQLALEYAKKDEFVADQIYFAHQAI